VGIGFCTCTFLFLGTCWSVYFGLDSCSSHTYFWAGQGKYRPTDDASQMQFTLAKLGNEQVSGVESFLSGFSAFPSRFAIHFRMYGRNTRQWGQRIHYLSRATCSHEFQKPQAGSRPRSNTSRFQAAEQVCSHPPHHCRHPTQISLQ
jgi:hypothetical protein